MLARLTAAIVPPAPEYVPKKRGLDSGEENNNNNNNNGDKGMELSVVVCPEFENADAQIPQLTSEYVSVALNMAIDEPKREDELDEREMEDSERILNKTDGSERFFSMSAVKKKFVWTIAKIDTKTARLRPLLLKGAKKIVSAIGREFARQFPPIESYVMENMLMRRAMEEEEMAIMNPDARRAFEESLLLGGKGVEEEEKKKTKDIEEVEEMVLEAPMVVVTSRKKVRNKRSWLRGSAVEEEASTSSSHSAPQDDEDIKPPATPPQKEELKETIQLPPQKELAAITKAKQRLREEEEKAKRNAILNRQNSKPLNFAPGWKKDVEVGDGTSAAVILASKSDVKSRKIRQPLKQSNRRLTDMFGSPSPPGKTQKKSSGSSSNKKKKNSPPKSAKKRRQFEEKRMAALFDNDQEKENKSRLEYSYYCSAGDTDIYVEAVVKPIKGKAL